MNWLAWLHRHPDPIEERRGRESAAKADELEVRAHDAITNAHRSTRSVERVIRENHLAPKIYAALRETR